MVAWVAIVGSVGALIVAALSYRETRRQNKKIEDRQAASQRAHLVVEWVDADRREGGNDRLFVRLRNLAAPAAVSLTATVWVRAAWYRLDSPAFNLLGGASVQLYFELPIGAVVRRPGSADSLGGGTGPADWVLPDDAYIECRFTDLSGERTERLSLRRPPA